MMVQIYDGRVRGVDLQRQTQNASSSAKKKKKKVPSQLSPSYQKQRESQAPSHSFMTATGCLGLSHHMGNDSPAETLATKHGAAAAASAMPALII
jgi:hypothetical protein